ncbi:MAG: tripartite tricarboxylate transporter substrate-binding protein, partial [Burkholderiales bacterium]
MGMIKRMKSRHFATGLGCVLALATGIATAQEYPTKSVRLVVPASPGGGLDIMARAVALELTPMWGQSVVVDNRPGAGVFLGTEMVAKAPADGYTLLMINSNLAPNLVLLNRLDVGKQLTGVAKIADLPTALAVNMSLPAKSVKDLIALAKTSKLAYSTTGNGTTSNIAGEMLKLAAKVDITHVPYKGGNPAMAAVISGEVGMGFASLASVRVYEKAGRVRVLAVASTKRSALAPDVPTLNETFPGVIVETWVGMVAPTGVPRPILRKVNADVVKVVRLPEISKRLLDQGYDLQPGSPEAMD